MAVAGVIGRAQFFQVERNHARRVRAIHQRFDTARGKFADDFFQRQHQAGRAGHMIQQRQPRPPRDVGEHGVHNLLRRSERKRNFRHDHARTGAGGDKIQRTTAGVVCVIRDEQFIAALEFQRT